MKRLNLTGVLAAAVLLAACSSAPTAPNPPAKPPATIAVPTAENKPTEVAKESAAKVLAKPVFIDFYAPW